MIVVIQRLLQLLVLAGLVFVIAKPGVLPEPARTMADNVHVWIMGESDTWESFQITWRQRFEAAGSLIPWFKTVATTIPPEPPQITADGVLDVFNTIIITRPLTKFESMKQDLLAIPTASVSSQDE
jgi:hypothetical protein